jgi:tripartite-type tricarboxylate transporter receptor subunit TctC
MKLISLLFAVLAAAFPSVGSAADNKFPSRPVTIIVTYPPGGTADIAVRILAQQLGEVLGQSVVVDNRPGGGGAIGWAAGARAPSDGYTLVALDSSFSMAPSIHSKLPFDPARDFVHLSGVFTSPYVVLAPPLPQYQSMKDLIDSAKANPGKLNYGTGGVGQNAHVIGELLNAQAGVKLTHIPYKGGAPSNQAVMTNEVQAVFPLLASAIPLVKSGKVRALMVTAEKRVPELPDVPSAREVGLPGMVASSWLWLAAPAKTPAAVQAKLSKAIADTVNSPATARRLIEAGLTPYATTSAQATKLVADETQRWSSVIKKAGIKAD